MKWRVIINISLDGQGPLRNTITNSLNKCADKTGTGTWETDGGEPVEVVRQLQEILLILAEITKDDTGDESVKLDHVSIYIDKGFKPKGNKFEIKV